MVREADAVLLASDVAQMLARRGHDVTIPRDGVRVIRLCALVLAEFGINGDTPVMRADPAQGALT
jgi:hypothetical protein